MTMSEKTYDLLEPHVIYISNLVFSCGNVTLSNDIGTKYYKSSVIIDKIKLL